MVYQCFYSVNKCFSIIIIDYYGVLGVIFQLFKLISGYFGVLLDSICRHGI